MDGFETCTSGVALALPNNGLPRLAALPLTLGVYCVLLRTLNTSKRNCPLSRSEILVSFVREISTNLRPLPRKIFRPAPYVPIAGGSSIEPFSAQHPYFARELEYV